MVCIFCKIVSGEVPCVRVYEDDTVLCFLDINPVEKVHTLVVLKRHAATLMETLPQELSQVILAVQKVSQAMMRCGADGINVLVNNNAVAGQEVPHLHFHVIPRVAQSAPRNWKSGAARYESAEEQAAVAARLRDAIKNLQI